MLAKSDNVELIRDGETFVRQPTTIVSFNSL